ncbi:MAG: protein-tyrosine phosphatase [Bacteroidia bacterium]
MDLFKRKTRILLVCTENICRSPMAEGLLKHYLAEMGLAKSVQVASAGTQANQPGLRPDTRAQKIAARSGIDISRVRARRITDRDFERSDMIVAMDTNNLEYLEKTCPPLERDKLSLLLSYAEGGEGRDVPDPYYGSTEGFESVFEIIDAAIYELVPHIARLIE